MDGDNKKAFEDLKQECEEVKMNLLHHKQMKQNLQLLNNFLRLFPLLLTVKIKKPWMGNL